MVRTPVISKATNTKVEAAINALVGVSISERLILKNSLLKLKSLNQHGLRFTPKDKKTAALLALYQSFDK